MCVEVFRGKESWYLKLIIKWFSVRMERESKCGKMAKYRKEYKGFNVPLLQFFDKYKIFKFKKIQ